MQHCWIYEWKIKFPTCCSVLIQALSAALSLIFSLFVSVLLLLSQLQHQQRPSPAQRAPSPACQGGEHLLSASLAPLASTVRSLASVPQLGSAGKVRGE